MTLWFDVTDLQWWPRPYLTGIQRTSAGVLSELLTMRSDIRLFAYDHSREMLLEITAPSLPPVVQSYIGASYGVEMDARDIAPELAVVSVDVPNGISLKAPQPVAQASWLSGTDVRQRIRRAASIRLRHWLGHEAVDALREFMKSGRTLLRVIGRKLLRIACEKTDVPGSTAGAVLSILQKAPSGRKLFQPGDICLSLAAAWGLAGYGDIIAENKLGGSVKCINLFYDLIPTLCPQWVAPGQSQFITLWVRQQIQNADILLTISKFQKNEIAKYIEAERLPFPPIEVIRLGDNPSFSANTKMKTGKSNSLPLPRYVPEKKFIICVSTLDVRKNQGLLYHVWRRLAEEFGPECPQLLLIGMPHLLVADLIYQMTNDRLVNRLIIHLHDIADEELAWYYRHCEFTLYPSLYEGWGLPICESLALGKYCIAGSKSSLPEAGGDLVDYFDPLDYLGCYQLVRRAATDPDYVRQRELEVLDKYRPYTWNMTARHVSEIVDHLSSSARRDASDAESRSS
jgi:glycosyltransferase involved in cell wall biosynthesis